MNSQTLIQKADSLYDAGQYDELYKLLSEHKVSVELVRIYNHIPHNSRTAQYAS